MEQVLEDIELQADTLRQFQALYAHRRQDLHNLRLSEELLPISFLRSILSRATTYEAVPVADINWYYTHGTVRPMWANPQYIVFEILILMVRPATFLLYRLQGWPVPSVPHMVAQILEKGDFGYDTNSGQLFEASHCTGSDPKVCSTGALFKAYSPP
jgi:hypothetical protein